MIIRDEDVRGVPLIPLAKARRFTKEDWIFYAQELLAQKDARIAADAEHGTAEEWKKKAEDTAMWRDYYKKDLDHFIEKVMQLEAKIEKLEGAPHRHSAAGRKPKYAAADAKRCADLRAEGKTLREIVKITGIGLGTVSKLLKKAKT